MTTIQDIQARLKERNKNLKPGERKQQVLTPIQYMSWSPSDWAKFLSKNEIDIFVFTPSGDIFKINDEGKLNQIIFKNMEENK